MESLVKVRVADRQESCTWQAVPDNQQDKESHTVNAQKGLSCADEWTAMQLWCKITWNGCNTYWLLFPMLSAAISSCVASSQAQQHLISLLASPSSLPNATADSTLSRLRNLRTNFSFASEKYVDSLWTDKVLERDARFSSIVALFSRERNEGQTMRIQKIWYKREWGWWISANLIWPQFTRFSCPHATHTWQSSCFGSTSAETVLADAVANLCQWQLRQFQHDSDKFCECPVTKDPRMLWQLHAKALYTKYQHALDKCSTDFCFGAAF